MNPHPDWQLRLIDGLSRTVPFPTDELLILSSSLDPGEKWLEQFRQILSRDEMERASRFRFEKHRRRFVAARGTLRTILAAFLDVAPREITFAYAERGKPFVEGDLRFNMSDSSDRAIFAIVRGREVGIDLEKIRKLRDAAGLARRFFAPGEAEHVVRAAEIERAFFTCWTRKEAYIKARGEGLSMPLDSFEVSVDPAEEPRLVSAMLDPSETKRWRMETFDPAPGYLAAVVVEAPELPVRTISLQF